MADANPLAQLTGPGGPFEIVIEDVVGHPTQVYKQRMKSMRELMVQSAGRSDVDFLVQGADVAKPRTAQRGSHVVVRHRGGRPQPRRARHARS